MASPFLPPLSTDEQARSTQPVNRFGDPLCHHRSGQPLEAAKWAVSLELGGGRGSQRPPTDRDDDFQQGICKGMNRVLRVATKARGRRAFSSCAHPPLATPNAQIRRYNIANRRGIHITNGHRSTLRRNQSSNKHVGGSELGIRIDGTIPFEGKGLQIGQYAEISRSYSQEDVEAFGTLIGDMNPVHFPNNRNQHSLERPIVHGILLSAAFSAIFGTLVPGAKYRSQLLKFHQPVYVGEGEEVCAQVIVNQVRQINREGDEGVYCICDTIVTKAAENAEDEDGDGVLCVSGEARVWLPGATVAANAE